MGNVHPDHAALIEAGRTRGGTFLKFEGYEYEGRLMVDLADALASAPSPPKKWAEEAQRRAEMPLVCAQCGENYYRRLDADDVPHDCAPSHRTPLLQEATEEMVAEFCHSADTNIEWGSMPHLPRRVVKTALNAALAAAPKVEQRTPTREEAYNVAWESVSRLGPLNHREHCIVDALIKLFTSPEAPESENPNRCETCDDKGMVPDTSPGRMTAWAQCPTCKGVRTDADGKKRYDGGRHG